MRKWVTKKTTLVGALACLIAIGSAAGAFAYFTGGGAGTTHGDTVGGASGLTVSFGTPAGVMYPGAGFDIIPYTVLNGGGGQQELSNVTATVNADANANITVNGTPVTGCKAAWFTASVGAPVLPVDLLASGVGAGDAFTGTLTISMIDSGTNQNACESQTPDVTISAS